MVQRLFLPKFGNFLIQIMLQQLQTFVIMGFTVVDSQNGIMYIESLQVSIIIQSYFFKSVARSRRWKFGGVENHCKPQTWRSGKRDFCAFPLIYEIFFRVYVLYKWLIFRLRQTFLFNDVRLNSLLVDCWR